jgi:hypothetical protein
MNPKGPETPLFLWICAAICAHFVFAESGEQVAIIHDDRKFLVQMADDVRGKIAPPVQTIEISTSDEGKPKEEEPPEPPKALPTAEKKPEPPAPTPPKQEAKKDQPKQEQVVKVEVKQDDPLKKLDQQELKADQRIAVKQHVQPKQEDNPTAKFIGDEANHVQEETAATQTAHDQDDPNPTPGTAKANGPKDQTGDSEHTKIADSEEHKGDKDRAPGEKGTEFDVQHDNKPIDKPMAQKAVEAPTPAAEQPKTGGDGRAPSAISEKETPQLAPGAPPAPSPEVEQSNASSGWSFNPIKPGAQADPQQAPIPGTTNQNKPVVPNTSQTKWLGLGGNPGPGQVNINLTQQGVVAIVGSDQLRKEREADGERRKSEHRGSWTASNFERWRNAIENYVSSVKPGNQTALNTAAVPFASYLNTIHNRIHPLFADSFLGSLDNLPKNHPLNDTRLITRLEIVVSPKEGRIVKMGVVKTSGITAFDIAALDSVNRAQPFGPAPGAIVSPDGNVYLHWEFHRDEVFACSTMHARPFILNTPPKGGPDEQNPPAPSGPGKSPSQERGAPPPVNIHETREGKLDIARPAHEG